MVGDYFICFYIYIFDIYAIMDYKIRYVLPNPFLNTILEIANLSFYSRELSSLKVQEYPPIWQIGWIKNQLNRVISSHTALNSMSLCACKL